MLCNMAVPWATEKVQNKIVLENTLVLLDLVLFVVKQLDSIFVWKNRLGIAFDITADSQYWSEVAKQ